jgi:hypothetical protein
MTSPSRTSPGSARYAMHPENELFDDACQVLEEARRLRSAARDERYERAVPATLGCVSSALVSLADATHDIQTHVDPGEHASLAELGRTLERAAQLADTARTCCGLPP